MRIVVLISAVTLLTTSFVGDTAPAAGADLGAAISSGRRSQQYYESAMLQQDRAVARSKALITQVRRSYKQAKRGIKRATRAHAAAKRTVKARQARLAKILDEYPTISDAPKPWRYERRLKKARKAVRIAQVRKQRAGRTVRTLVRARKARAVRIRALKRQRGAAISRREAAEGGLAAHIVRMTSLASARARTQSAVSLSASNGSFSWPSVGRISQTYGCTGFRYNPRRGSCRHFHDGLDIVAGYGSPVRAAAVGVVAYVGWNPWDEGGRAFIVVVSHPDGFVTRYGHLVSRKRVRAGQLVHTGQVIGRMGNTGRSTGTHLHFELLKGGSDVNPLGYLPSGGHKIRIDKKSTKKGVAKAARKARAKARAASRRQARKERKAARRAAARAAALPVECTPLAEAERSDLLASMMVAYSTGEPDPGETVAVLADCTPSEGTPATDSTEDSALPDGSERAEPRPAGVRMPFRGTSPIPE